METQNTHWQRSTVLDQSTGLGGAQPVTCNWSIQTCLSMSPADTQSEALPIPSMVIACVGLHIGSSRHLATHVTACTSCIGLLSSVPAKINLAKIGPNKS